ncbi:hypothetical protein CDD80_2313 [Ophiocordyceps camponoti-rufipedis]|uniref:Uncharacterized protein n=1 Tax=Ophiocordyceps camponoti-rufipedis TaxID=2004952 RepID=A0A2C5Z688_9HYPO|nr:hypothetical protein CDD80_2313 [Ophiocordyceps camponoti-rufipedis]
MDTARFLAKVYDPDTLDTRFTTSSSVPYETVVDGRRREREGKASAPPVLTLEFCLYHLIVWMVVPYMFWVTYDVSRPSDPRYAKYERYLSPGWILGRKVDVSDAQYHTFRRNVPFMAGFLVCHPLLRLAWNAFNRKPKTSSLALGGTARLLERVSFDYYFAILFLVILHGVSALKVLAILYINYRIAKGLPRRFVPAATWAFNIAILFANDIYHGYRLEPVAARFAAADSNLVHWAGWLDGHGGLMARWEVLFNISVLRLISFNMDYYWSFEGRHAESLEVRSAKPSTPFTSSDAPAQRRKKKQLDRANLSEKERISTGAEPGDYSFRNYVAYAVYAPLYLAGPILTFNDYVAQSRHRAASIETARTLRYGLRFLLALLVMEVVLHIDYVGAIAKANPDWSSYTPAQLSILSLFNLHVIWLKLLLPWRLFRLWALVDGIDPPENMVRCVSNNYSTQLFWRAWHRSYNRWLIRYLYGPLIGYPMAVKGPGGRWRSVARAVMTYLTVFTFVALWHDIQMRLLIWGWLIVVFMLPEWTAVWLFPRRLWESRPVKYRLLCGIGGVMNVLLMMSANLVGFAVGLDGLQSIIRGIFRDWSGFVFLLTACSCLFVGVQVMFRVREKEMKRGVTLRC